MNLKRNLTILKCRAYIFARHLIEKVLLKFAEWKLIKCHKRTYSQVFDETTPQSAPDFTSDRFIFSVSYILRKIEFIYEYWFETKRGKRIFTVDDARHVEGRVTYRAELKAFYAHFSPKMRQWVDYTHPVVQHFMEQSFSPVSKDAPIKPILLHTYRLDFSKCRYAFEFSYAPEMLDARKLSEVLSQSHRAFGNQLTSKVPEINKILTGADCDGEMMSPYKTPLCDNLLCRRCGLPVFASAKRKYSFMCLKHGEIEHPEVDRVDPILYKDVLENTMDILEDLITNFDTSECPQD